MSQFVCDYSGVHEVPEIQASTLANPDPWMWDAFGGGVRSDSDVPVNARSILSHPPMWQGINILSGHCAFLPRKLKKRMGDKTTDDRKHIAYRLMTQKTNPWMHADTFLRLLVMRATIHGNGIAEIARNNAGAPVSWRDGGMTPLPPATTKPEYDDDGKLWIVTRILINGQVEPRKIDPDDTFHLKGLSENGIWGMSLRQVATNTIGYGLSLQRHGNVTFKNRARPDILVMHPGLLGKEAAGHLRESWNAIHQGLDNTSRLAVLEEGMTAMPFSQSNEDAQWIEAQRFDVSQSARILDMPSPMLNDLEKATFRNIEEQRIWYVNDRLYRLQKTVTNEAELKLLTERERERMFFLYNNDILLKGKQKERFESYKSAISSMWLKRNEVREEEGLDPEDGLDEFINPNTTSGGKPDGSSDGSSNGPPTPEEDSVEERLAAVEQRNVRLMASSIQAWMLREQQLVSSASKRETNFVSWLTEFYGTEWPNTLSEEVVSSDVAYEYCGKRQAFWLNVSGGVHSTGELKDAITNAAGNVREVGRQLLNMELKPCG